MRTQFAVYRKYAYLDIFGTTYTGKNLLFTTDNEEFAKEFKKKCDESDFPKKNKNQHCENYIAIEECVNIDNESELENVVKFGC